MKVSELFKRNKKYVLLATAAIFVIAVVVVLLVVFIPKRDNNQDIPDNIDETTQSVVDTTPIDGELSDPENQDFENENGNIIDTEYIQIIEGKSNGIDVSKWQGIIDWKKVKESGIQFAFVRIGYRGENGVIYKDEFAEYNLQQAHKNNVLTGVYFFSTAVNIAEAKEEAEWTLEFIKGYHISYPVVYDCEGYKNPNSRMFGLDAKMRTDNALEFLSLVSKNGYDTMLYGARNELSLPYYWDISRIQKNHRIWVAQYPEITYPDIEFPDYEGRVDAWQYTNKGIVDGINGNTDLVVCYFEEELKQPKNPEIVHKEVKAPEVDSSDKYTEVNEQVTAKEVTNLRVSPTTKSDIVVTLKNGEFVTRTGVGTKGWSRLDYNGQTVYAITSYLTTEIKQEEKEPVDEVNGIKFEETNDKVTAKIKVNLRSLPSTVSGEIVGSLESGTFLDRVAISTQGWSRLIYNGQEVYAVSNYLSNEVITQSTEPSVDEREVFSPIDEMVTAKIETNLRTKPNTNDSEIVYTLKNGEYVKRVGINNTTGWSQLEYNGVKVYAVSSYLTVQE